MKFKSFTHTADLGIYAFGNTLTELFENAAEGMFTKIADIKNIDIDTEVSLKVKASGAEELLVNFLQELLFNFETKKILFKKVKITHFGKDTIRYIGYGKKITPQDKIYREIKAVTYHMLKIEKDTKNRLRAKILFDV